MAPHPANGLTLAEREGKRAEYQARLSTALRKKADPLAAYYHFVAWMCNNYDQSDPNSGLRDLVKEATDLFKDYEMYKNDLRYLKLWLLAARQLDKTDAITVYAYLVTHHIGTTYSVLYEVYAELLEAQGRWKEADAIYRQGIKKAPRPPGKLEKRYAKFLSSAPPCAVVNPPITSVPGSSSKAATFRNTGLSAGLSDAPASFSISKPLNLTAESRYAVMLAPPAPWKRPEKLRFDMNLLWTNDGVEYSIQEARARSMGLPSKKWGQLPVFDMRTSIAETTAIVDFSDGGHEAPQRRVGGRKSLISSAEKTVIIDIKEEIPGIYGMNTSPDATTKLASSKQAPMKNVESITPASMPRLAFVKNAETLYTDKNAKPTATGIPTAQPFVDDNHRKIPLFIDSPPVSTVREVLHTPLDPLAPLRETLNDKGTTRGQAPMHDRNKFQYDALTSISENTSTSSNGLVAPTPSQMFSRPGSNTTALPRATRTEYNTPSTVSCLLEDEGPPFTLLETAAPAWMPLVDNEAKSQPVLHLAPFNEPPWHVFQSTVVKVRDHKEEPETQVPLQVPRYNPNGQQEYEKQGCHVVGESEMYACQRDVATQLENLPLETEDKLNSAPLGGRFRAFNVLTPIMERSLE